MANGFKNKKDGGVVKNLYLDGVNDGFVVFFKRNLKYILELRFFEKTC